MPLSSILGASGASSIWGASGVSSILGALVSWVPLVPLVSGVWRLLLLMSGMSVVHCLSV